MEVFLKGVYLLFDKENVVYVGQSSDIYRRIYEHSSGRAKGEKKVFDSWEYFVVEDEEERNKAEYILIKALHPKYNVDIDCRFQTKRVKEVSRSEEVMFRVKYAVGEVSSYYDSISANDADTLFGVPHGTFAEAVRNGNFDKKDLVQNGFFSKFVPRIRNEKFFEMLGKWILEKEK